MHCKFGRVCHSGVKKYYHKISSRVDQDGKNLSKCININYFTVVVVVVVVFGCYNLVVLLFTYCCIHFQTITILIMQFQIGTFK